VHGSGRLKDPAHSISVNVVKNDLVQYVDLVVHFLRLTAADGKVLKRATYDELESINVNLTAFPAVDFFRVEVPCLQC
jgi:hypothetical protein